MQFFKSKMGDLNKQVSSLTDEKRQMEARVATLEQENAVQHAQPDAGATSGPRIEELQKLNVGGFFISLWGHPSAGF